MSHNLLEQIGAAFAGAQRVLVISHIRPDGDAVGSLLGLGLSLSLTGKQVQMVLEDGLPANFRHLPGSQQVVSRPQGEFDLVVVVDCSDLERVGRVLQRVSPVLGTLGSQAPGPRGVDVNIDHHITNLNFARLNLVDSTAASTAEMLALHLPTWGLPVDGSVAAALMTGILADSLGFRTANVSPRTLRIAADLLEMGVDLHELYMQALMLRSFESVRFWGIGLENLERQGPMVWTSLTQADRRAVGYQGRDDADLINVLSSIQDAAVALIFVEQPNDRVKVSWRAQPGLDVSQVALNFGGGGHPAAAGAEIAGNLDDVQKRVLEETRKILEA